jgi:Zn-finger nucleic acid-binding protein
MMCPACKDTVLSMTDRQGIEIDFCPKCRGVWLDRGELDKIIERSAAATEATPAPSQQTPPHQPQQQPQYQQQPYYKGYKRKKSFLEELFD